MGLVSETGWRLVSHLPADHFTPRALETQYRIADKSTSFFFSFLFTCTRQLCLFRAENQLYFIFLLQFLIVCLVVWMLMEMLPINKVNLREPISWITRPREEEFYRHRLPSSRKFPKRNQIRISTEFILSNYIQPAYRDTSAYRSKQNPYTGQG